MSLLEAINQNNSEKIKLILEDETISDEELKELMFVIYELGYHSLFELFLDYPVVWDLVYYFAVRTKNFALYKLVLEKSNFDPIFELSEAHILALKGKKFDLKEINKPDLLGITPLHIMFWSKKYPKVDIFLKKQNEIFELDKFGRSPMDLAK